MANLGAGVGVTLSQMAILPTWEIVLLLGWPIPVCLILFAYEILKDG